ncbi:FMn-dependent 2-nitropropane dioxygenase [Fusarium subglutinans]|uniref:FMn-dependent 2-nitropropane dioxygenase n=2 Tax=Fusarium fujikuroi species complex TaxID=171627 RepID=A0A8H5V2Z1_GIBSU|nr:FMn-dependent 2-nitropropane dioxygenase [Fusarium subglutinans]KAF5607428.1 FMn-dependent 2-nitropropane dioxygenase [Fusarium subglutinans]
MAPPGPITTPLTSLLGIKHPIILAGMARVSGGRLAAAVSNAGGLGIIGGFQYTPDQLREIIAEMKANFSRPDLPFGVDLALPQIGGNARKTNHDYTGGKLDELVDIIIDSGAKLFVSAVGVPPPQVIKRFHDKGILVMNMVGHPKHATKALELGVDMVCAQGGEGGGHTGDVANSILIPAVADVASKYHPPLLKGLPALVVAAGGIYSGRSLASSLMQGAVAVWVGTRFVASVEASCSEEHKKEVVSCGFEDTQRTLVISGRPLRMKTNDYIRKWHEQPDKIKELCDKGVVPIEYDFEQGNDFDLPHLMGQVAGAITKIQPAGEIVDEMVKEAVDMLKLGGTYLTAIPRLQTNELENNGSLVLFTWASPSPHPLPSAAVAMSTSSFQESVSSNMSMSDEETEYIPWESCTVPPKNLEHVFPTLDTKTNQFVRMPETDYIFISLDFHHICGKEPSVSLERPSSRHDPIIEAGIAYIDMRDILYDRGKGVLPGDRGSSWFKYMAPLHYIVEEFENQDISDQSPYLFAFDRSKKVPEKNLAHRLYRVFAGLKKKNRRKDEVEQGRLRQLILLTFDAEPVKTGLLQLELDWLAEPNLQIWELKKEKQFETRLQQPAVFEHVLERLGIRFEDTRFGKLSSCSGNASVFMIQMILAFFYRDEVQKALFEDRRPLKWLRYTWVPSRLPYLTLWDTTRITGREMIKDITHLTHNKVINYKSTDDKMADNKMAGEKASENKSTEKIAPEKKATEGENTEETSTNAETTDAYRSEGMSAEDEVVKLSVIRQHLSVEMPDLFFNVFSKEGLGLPSQYHYPSAFDWLQKIILKFHHKGDQADDDDDSELALKLPGALSAAGMEVSQDFLLRYKINGWIPPKCWRCTIQDHLDRWTIEARQITGYERLWAMCGPLHGMEEDDFGILTRAKKFTDKLEEKVTENARVLLRLLRQTPEPSHSEKDKDGRGIFGRDLEYYLNDLDYYVEVEDDEKGESDSTEEDEEDGRDGDYELPVLKVTPPTP